MYSKAKISGHPIHPMIVDFPIVLYTLAAVSFVVYKYFYTDLFWYRLGYFSTLAGVVMAVVAAVPGFIDWAFGIPRGTAAKKRGLIHAGLNVTALILFIISAVRLYGNWDSPIVNVTPVMWLSIVGFVLTLFAGYQGWELIGTHKVGVTMTPEQERLEPVEKYERKEHKISQQRPQPV
jgi:uncharacterized membrane protein